MTARERMTASLSAVTWTALHPFSVRYLRTLDVASSAGQTPSAARESRTNHGLDHRSISSVRTDNPSVHGVQVTLPSRVCVACARVRSLVMCRSRLRSLGLSLACASQPNSRHRTDGPGKIAGGESKVHMYDCASHPQHADYRLDVFRIA
jgi:hypothetical protein